jgi:PIN domain nuclease of toxin-antitoxin system
LKDEGLDAFPSLSLLIAQCLVEGLTIVTHDGDMARYDVPVLNA